jgi:hypothetical protein
MIKLPILDDLYQVAIARFGSNTMLSRLTDDDATPDSSLPKTIWDFLQTYSGQLAHIKLAEYLITRGIAPGPWRETLDEVVSGKALLPAHVFEARLAEAYKIPYIPINREVSGEVLLTDIFYPGDVRTMDVHNAYGLYATPDDKLSPKFIKPPTLGKQWLSRIIGSGFEPLDSLQTYTTFWAKALPGSSDLVYPAVKLWHNSKANVILIKFDVTREDGGEVSSDLNGYLFYGRVPCPKTYPVAFYQIIISWFDFGISASKDSEKSDCSLITLVPRPIALETLKSGARGVVVLHTEPQNCFFYCEGDSTSCIPAPAGCVEFEPEAWRLTGAVRMTSRFVTSLDRHN